MPTSGGALSGKTCSNQILSSCCIHEDPESGPSEQGSAIEKTVLVCIYCAVARCQGPLVPGMVHITLRWECGVGVTVSGNCSFCELCVDSETCPQVPALLLCLEPISAC